MYFIKTIIAIVFLAGIIMPLVVVQALGPPITNSTNQANPDSYAGQNDPHPQIENPIKAQSLPELISRVIQILLGLIAMVAVVAIIVGGFRMVAAGGNPDQIKTAKATILWAVLGLAVALLSFSMVSVLQRLIK